MFEQSEITTKLGKIFSGQDVHSLSEKFRALSSSDDIKKLLLTPLSDTFGDAFPNDRLVDSFIRSKEGCTLLNQMVDYMTPHDWYEVINQKNPSTQLDILSVWIKSKFTPPVLTLSFMKNLPSNQEKVAILTKSVEIEKRMDQVVEVSILANPTILPEISMGLLGGLSDHEKVQAMLSPTGGSIVVNLVMLSLMTEPPCYDRLLRLIRDEDERKKLEAQKNKIEKNVLKSMGHFLGVKGNVKSNNYSGMWTSPGISAFQKVLSNHHPKQGYKPEFEQIQKAFNAISSIKSTSVEQSAKQNFDTYRKGELIILPSGWPEHSITVAAINGYLVVGNRGDGGNLSGGCVIHKLNRELAQEDIAVLLKMKSKDIIINKIQNLSQNSREPVCILPLKEQKYGTCAIANKKACVAGLLPLLKALNRVNAESVAAASWWSRPYSAVTSYFSANPVTSPAITITPDEVKQSMSAYKDFTRHSRHTILSEALSTLIDSEVTDHEEVIDAIADFCNEHIDIRKVNEVALLQRIAKEIPKEDFDSLSPRLLPHSKLMLNYLYNNGNIDPFSPLMEAYFRSIADEDKPIQDELLQLVDNFLNHKQTPDESYQWCTKHVYFLLTHKLYDFFSEQFSKLDPEQRKEIAKNPETKLVSRLIHAALFADSEEEQLRLRNLINQLLENVTPEELPPFLRMWSENLDGINKAERILGNDILQKVLFTPAGLIRMTTYHPAAYEYVLKRIPADIVLNSMTDLQNAFNPPNMRFAFKGTNKHIANKKANLELLQSWAAQQKTPDALDDVRKEALMNDPSKENTKPKHR